MPNGTGATGYGIGKLINIQVLKNGQYPNQILSWERKQYTAQFHLVHIIVTVFGIRFAYYEQQEVPCVSLADMFVRVAVCELCCVAVAFSCFLASAIPTRLAIHENKIDMMRKQNKKEKCRYITELHRYWTLSSFILTYSHLGIKGKAVQFSCFVSFPFSGEIMMIKHVSTFAYIWGTRGGPLSHEHGKGLHKTPRWITSLPPPIDRPKWDPNKCNMIRSNYTYLFLQICDLRYLQFLH